MCYYEFRKKYPIFDFGFNHREKKVRHDCYSNFFGKNESNAEAGYKYARKTLEEIR